MRSTVIPAQITSVEDKITSFLNLKQIIILVVNLILVMIIFLIIPPLVKFTFLKMIIAIILSLIITPLSFKYKGHILIEYLSLILGYKFRPKTFVLIRDDQPIEDLSFNKISERSQKLNHTSLNNLKKLSFSYGYGKKGGVYVQFIK